MFETMFFKVLMTFFLSMVPVVELRGAIPAGIAAGISPMAAFVIAVVGNLVPVPFIILLIRRIFLWLRKVRFFGGVIEKLESKAHLKGRLVRKYGPLGLIVLVAIPLPGTGAWTGALVAALLDISLRRAIPSIILGVVIAGAITTAVTCGVVHIFG